jgi:UDP-N-acetylmuramoyl-L-alanyl-D-glutamate--2,6-diaminopimelate ligase
VSSHSILQNRINEVAFDVAVFTNLTRDHLDYHGTMEEYFEAKSLLFSEAPNATAVVNTDDPYGRRLTEEGRLPGKLVTYGTEASAEVRAENITLSESGSSFTVKTPWGTGDVQTRLRGRFNVSNMLAAIAACGDLGVEMECVSRALSEITHIPGRLEEIRSASGFSVFVDYAHTDDALLNVLSTLKEITKGRLIVVFGCGGDRDRTKRPAMGAVASDLADYSILTSDNPRNEDPSSIIAEIEQGFKATDRFEVVEDRREAIERAVAMAESGDTVLVAGKGHETFQEFDKTTVPFDDRQIVKEILGEPSMGSN